MEFSDNVLLTSRIGDSLFARETAQSICPENGRVYLPEKQYSLFIREFREFSENFLNSGENVKSDFHGN